MKNIKLKVDHSSSSLCNGALTTKSHPISLKLKIGNYSHGEVAKPRLASWFDWKSQQIFILLRKVLKFLKNFIWTKFLHFSRIDQLA